jgi:hypothetical protein
MKRKTKEIFQVLVLVLLLAIAIIYVAINYPSNFS